MTGTLDITRAAESAVAAAIRAGADDAEVWIERAAEREIRVSEGEVESLTDATISGMGIRSLRGGRCGYAYGSNLSREGLRALADAASVAASFAEPDEHVTVAEAAVLPVVPGSCNGASAAWSLPRKIALALAVERAARSHRSVRLVEETIYVDRTLEVAVANSRGLAASYEWSTAEATAVALAGDAGNLVNGLGAGLARHPCGLDAEAIGAEAAVRASELIGARQPQSGRYAVVLDAFVVGDLMAYIGRMLSADAAGRGRSMFAGLEGEAVASSAFTLVDDGIDPQGPSSAPFDGEGSARRRTPVIDAGHLVTLLHDRRTASMAERQTTGNARRTSYRVMPRAAPSNLVVEGGDVAVDQLAALAGEGIYVSTVIGLHSGINPISGNFSVGAAGRTIEGGELGRPLHELTIAGDLMSMLAGIRLVGGPGRWIAGTNVRAAPMLVAELQVSGG